MTTYKLASYADLLGVSSRVLSVVGEDCVTSQKNVYVGRYLQTHPYTTYILVTKESLRLAKDQAALILTRSLGSVMALNTVLAVSATKSTSSRRH